MKLRMVQICKEEVEYNIEFFDSIVSNVIYF